MKYYRTITLKDGRECILRNGTEEDGRQALENFIRAHYQTDNLLTYPDEITFTAQEEGEYLKKKEDSDREAEILAIADGRVIGTAGIESLGDHEKTRHRCSFGVSIEEAYWGLGIGRALLSSCIECAKRANYRQIELEVVSDNERAIGMYHQAGFVEYGRNPFGFITREGAYQELVLMRLDLMK